MKTVKLAMMALAALSSIGTAFAFSPAAKKNATTYYAVKSNGSFVWQPQQPSRLSCLPTATSAICTITTANAPVNGQIPAGHASTMQVYK
ncbi:DUF6520 family protein [Mucilaginibacter lacusdianchii]|uniref:DUF6520 family protein n=1 Tax=Mucilaginibacter lacusdianchii TaxID=2684211 RepID=UPI00131E2F23|nr:DUF6520 family protein [Mucilaginibacter sp. JXJ CY 39]